MVDEKDLIEFRNQEMVYRKIEREREREKENKENQLHIYEWKEK